MYEKPAMTYTPAVETGEDGVEHYDFNHGEVVTRNGGQSYEHPYVIDEETGARQYLIEDSDLEQDQDYEPSIHDEYIEAITQLYPDLQDAFEYARENWHPDLIAEYDEAVESGNIDHFVPLLEELMEEYRSEVGAPVSEEETTGEVSQEDIDSAIEPMLQMEAEGLETAYEWAYQASQYQDANPCYSAICAATARFHDGSMTASEAISSVLENYPLSDVIPIYKQLTEQ